MRDAASGESYLAPIPSPADQAEAASSDPVCDGLAGWLQLWTAAMQLPIFLLYKE